MKKFTWDIIILQMCTKNHNHMMYGSWDMECDRQNFLSLWTISCPFSTPPMDPENQNFEKLKRALEDIIILQMFSINDSHMIYGFSDMECNKIFCHFGQFSALLPQQSKFWKTEKNPRKISSFYTSVPKVIILCYTVP